MDFSINESSIKAFRIVKSEGEHCGIRSDYQCSNRLNYIKYKNS